MVSNEVQTDIQLPISNLCHQQLLHAFFPSTDTSIERAAQSLYSTRFSQVPSELFVDTVPWSTTNNAMIYGFHL